MMNDRLERVQLGRSGDVPVQDVWYLLVYADGSWDAGQSNEPDFKAELKREDLLHVFAVWHGQYRTRLFLMDKKDLLEKLK